MSSLIWTLKEWFRNVVKLGMIAGALYGAFALYNGRVFRHGIKPAVYSVLQKVPVFGSQFRHYRSRGRHVSRARGRHHRRHLARRGHRSRHYR